MNRNCLPLVLFAFACTPVAAAAQQATPSGFTIAGVVIDAVTNNPLPFARVFLDEQGRRGLGGDSLAWMKTGKDGRFRFRVARAGMYSLSAQYRGVTQRFGQSYPGSGFSVAVRTGPDFDTGNLAFRWFPVSSISGQVVDDAGDPIENARLQLIRVDVLAGRQAMAPAGWTRTDEQGKYRLGAVPGGSYFVVVTASERADNFAEESNSPVDAFVPAYFPAPPSLTSVDKALRLKPAEDLRADFTLRRTSGVEVRLTLGPGHMAVGNRQLILLPEALEEVQSVQAQDWVVSSRQVIRGVPPGRYILRMTGSKSGRPYRAEKRITVSGESMQVDFEDPRVAAINGVVTFSSATRPKRSLSLNLANDASRFFYNAPLTESSGKWQFSIPDVFAGLYRPVLLGSEGFFIEELEASGAAVDGQRRVEIAEGSVVELKLRLNGETGNVKGIAVDEKGAALPGVLVILADFRGKHPSGRGYLTDSDGTFTFTQALAGEYVIACVDDPRFEYADSGKLRIVQSMGRKLPVPTNDVDAGRVPLIRLKEPGR